MDMIGHQAVHVRTNLVRFRALGKTIQKSTPIRIILENNPAFIATTRNVVDPTLEQYSWSPSHVAIQTTTHIPRQVLFIIQGLTPGAPRAGAEGRVFQRNHYSRADPVFTPTHACPK
jgi:hypothetical protein